MSSISLPPKTHMSVCVGDKIEVWWPLDSAFYPGIVASELSDGRHRVEYADGDVEVLRLGEERWRFYGGNTPSAVSRNSAPGTEGQENNHDRTENDKAKEKQARDFWTVVLDDNEVQTASNGPHSRGTPQSSADTGRTLQTSPLSEAFDGLHAREDAARFSQFLHSVEPSSQNKPTGKQFRGGKLRLV